MDVDGKDHEKMDYHKGASDNATSRIEEEKGNSPNSDATSTHSETKPASAEDENEYVTGSKLWILLASVTLIVFLMMLDMSIVVTAIPRITSDFHSLPDVGWYGSAYLLANCAVQPLTGKFYTHFSLKWTFFAFVALFEVGSVLCGAAQSSNMLIIGRAVAGLGSSGLTNGALTILSAAAPLHKRPVLLGIMMAVSQFGVIGGPLIGGAFTEYVSWRWCFYINLPIGAVGLVLLLIISLPDRRTQENKGARTAFSILSKLDLPGFALFAPFAVMLLLAVEWGGSKHPWNSATIIGLFCGAFATLILFAAWEYKAGDGAMIPWSIIRRRVVWCSCLVMFCIFGSMLAVTYYLPIWFQAVRGASPMTSGVDLLPSILSQMTMSIASGVLVGKLGYYLPWSVGGAGVFAVGAGLLATFTPHTRTAAWAGFQIIAGLGRGCVMQMPLLAVQTVLPPAQNSLAMSLLMFSQTLGGSIFLTIAQTVFSQGLENGLEKYAPNVDKQSVIVAGATAFRNVINPEDVPGVLRAYNDGTNQAFYLAAGAAAGAFAFSFGIGWYSVKKKAPVPSDV